MNNNEYRLMPVKLLPAIKDALVESGKCFMPEHTWACVVAAFDRVAPAIPQSANHTRLLGLAMELREYAGNPGYSHNDYADIMSKAAEEIDGFLLAAAPERSETPADEFGQKVTMLVSEIRAAKSLAMRDSLIEKLLDLIEPNPAPTVSSSVAPSDERVSPHDVCRETERFYKQRINELEAARIAYASEFPADAEGDPDVGNIHANIRALKKQLATPSVQAVAAPVAGQGESAKKTLEASEEYLNADGESRTYKWLSTAAKDGIPEVTHAARTMMAYYCGAEFPAASPVELTDAAIEWFESNRPVDWAEEYHVKYPGVNCNSQADERLAKAVGRHLSRTAGGNGASKHSGNCLCDSCVNPLL
jgi:hypothetical protein